MRCNRNKIYSLNRLSPQKPGVESGSGLADCKNCYGEIRPGTSHVSTSFGTCQVIDPLTGRGLSISRRGSNKRVSVKVVS